MCADCDVRPAGEGPRSGPDHPADLLPMTPPPESSREGVGRPRAVWVDGRPPWVHASGALAIAAAAAAAVSAAAARAADRRLPPDRHARTSALVTAC